MSLAVVIFGAGLGTRMKSQLPKVLHEAAGRALVEHVILAAQPLKPERIVVVVGYRANLVKERLKGWDVSFALQEAQLGTGHALMQAEDALSGFEGDVMVLNGDGPLIKTETLERLAQTQRDKPGMTLVTCKVSDPTGMGRIIRAENGTVARIVEEKDANESEKLISEINPGIYIFDHTVFAKTKLLDNSNAAGEYYITDLPAHYLEDGREVRAVLVEDEREVLGVNNRAHLADIERILSNRIREKWLLSGVTMASPEQTFIDDTVELGADVRLEPGVILKGETVIGEGAHIGAYAHLTDCSVAENARVAPHTVQAGTTL